MAGTRRSFKTGARQKFAALPFLTLHGNLSGICLKQEPPAFCWPCVRVRRQAEIRRRRYPAALGGPGRQPLILGGRGHGRRDREETSRSFCNGAGHLRRGDLGRGSRCRPTPRSFPAVPPRRRYEIWDCRADYLYAGVREDDPGRALKFTVPVVIKMP